MKSPAATSTNSSGFARSLAWATESEWIGMAKPPKRKPVAMIVPAVSPVATDMARLAAIAPVVVARSTVRRLSRSERAPIGSCTTASPAMKALISQAISATLRPCFRSATGAAVRNAPC